MGPAGIYTVLYPPPDPQVGRRFDFLLNIILYSYQVLTHIFFNFTVFHLFYWINKVFTFTLVFSFWFCQSSLWVLYFGMKYGYGLWYFSRSFLWYSDGTCSVQGGCTPPPWSRAPRQESCRSRSIMCTHVLVLDLHNCTMLGVWMHQGIVLS